MPEGPERGALLQRMAGRLPVAKARDVLAYVPALREHRAPLRRLDQLAVDVRRQRHHGGRARVKGQRELERLELGGAFRGRAAVRGTFEAPQHQAAGQAHADASGIAAAAATAAAAAAAAAAAVHPVRKRLRALLRLAKAPLRDVVPALVQCAEAEVGRVRLAGAALAEAARPARGGLLALCRAHAAAQRVERGVRGAQVLAVHRVHEAAVASGLRVRAAVAVDGQCAQEERCAERLIRQHHQRCGHPSLVDRDGFHTDGARAAAVLCDMPLRAQLGRRRQTDRQTDRPTDRQTDRQTDR